jgi:exosortase family protein XrtF
MRFQKHIRFAKAVPPDIRSFLLKALGIFTAWKLVYHLLLESARTVDRPLVDITAKATAGLVAALSLPVSSRADAEKAYIDLEGMEVLSIADGCNALELYVLHLGFIACMPGFPKRKVLFGLGGLVLIFLLNIIRCGTLVWLHLSHPEWMDLAHHFLFYLVVYGFIFYVWKLFCNPPAK